MIKGFLPVSFIDWKGRLSSVIFFGGCNFRCPFCHNRDLVINFRDLPSIPLRSILNHLEEYKRWIDSIVLTGGEPTLHRNLLRILKDLKKRGFHLKLDTNGSNPDLLKIAIEENLIDYVAMDIKGPLDKYERFAGVEVEREKIEKSIEILVQSKIEHEFRMTIVPFLHKEEDIYEVALLLKDKGIFVLQNFRPVNTLNPSFSSIKPFSEEKLEELKEKIEKRIKETLFEETFESPPS